MPNQAAANPLAIWREDLTGSGPCLFIGPTWFTLPSGVLYSRLARLGYRPEQFNGRAYRSTVYPGVVVAQLA